jgi:hypothetical protein
MSAIPIRAILLALPLAICALPAYSEAGPVFQVDFSNPGLSPSHWTLTLHPDGRGHFRSQRESVPVKPLQEMDAPSVDRDIRLGQEFTQRVFHTAQQHKWSGEECESHLKVAFQGWKKISYSGPEGHGACEFNYSKDKDIQALGDSLVAVAGTIQEGARLEMLLAHDRLGLDREMEYLIEAAGDGRVQQVCVIQGILERLAEDTGVMDRVRKRARMLLAKEER